MSLRNKLHSRIQELIVLRKRGWKLCKKWVTKSIRSFERNTSSSEAYGITQPVSGTAGLMNDNINVENDDAIEDSNTSSQTDLEEAWKSLNEAERQLADLKEEKVQREERLARTRNSLRDSSMTKSERDGLQRQARCEQWLIEKSEENIRTARQTWQRENEYFSDVMAISFQ